MSEKKNSKTFWIILSVILILGLGGAAYYKAVYLPAQMPVDAALPEQVVPTAIVQQGDLLVYTRGSGALVAIDQIQLRFGSGGPIAELNVKPGDTVQPGDVLAIQGNQEQAQALIARGQLAVMKAQQALDALYDNAAAADAQAQLDLANARVALQKVETKVRGQEAGGRASSSTIDSLKAQLVLAQNELDFAKRKYEQVAGRPENNLERAHAQINLAAAQQKYDTVARKLQWYTGQPTDVQQVQLEAELAQAQALVAQAESAWEKVKEGRPNPDQVALAEQELASAEAELALSQHNLEAATIIAPMDGTVLAVKAVVGQDVSTPFITLADLSQLYLDISLNAVDLDKVAPSDAVEIIFDALPNQIFSGSLVQIDPSLYDTSGQIATQTPGQMAIVKGLVILDESAMSAAMNLPLGMTAIVDIVGGRAEGVMLVPVEALHEQSPGQYIVYVMEGGTQQPRPVDVGLMDMSFAEIKSGIKVGEAVVTGIVVETPAP